MFFGGGGGGGRLLVGFLKGLLSLCCLMLANVPLGGLLLLKAVVAFFLNGSRLLEANGTCNSVVDMEIYYCQSKVFLSLTSPASQAAS